MPIFTPLESRSEREELLDSPGHAPKLIADNLADMRRVNKWLGGVTLTRWGIERLLQSRTNGVSNELDILDVGCGCGDIPLAIRAWLNRRALSSRISAVDISPEVINVLPKEAVDIFDVTVGDGRRLPFVDSSFHVAICSLTLHHIGPAEAVQTLAEMGRVSQLGVVVNDVLRSRLGYWGAAALSRTFTRNPLTRHDAPLSVQRAYTEGEMAELARDAGLKNIAFKGFLRYRVAMVASV